jgi:hypothetical protein
MHCCAPVYKRYGNLYAYIYIYVCIYIYIYINTHTHTHTHTYLWRPGWWRRGLERQRQGDLKYIYIYIYIYIYKHTKTHTHTHTHNNNNFHNNTIYIGRPGWWRRDWKSNGREISKGPSNASRRQWRETRLIMRPTMASLLSCSLAAAVAWGIGGQACLKKVEEGQMA